MTVKTDLIEKFNMVVSVTTTLILYQEPVIGQNPRRIYSKHAIAPKR